MVLLEFEVGLELDSAEVRGVLLYNGVECGRSVLQSPSQNFCLAGWLKKLHVFCRVVFDFLI